MTKLEPITAAEAAEEARVDAMYEILRPLRPAEITALYEAAEDEIVQHMCDMSDESFQDGMNNVLNEQQLYIASVEDDISDWLSELAAEWNSYCSPPRPEDKARYEMLQSRAQRRIDILRTLAMFEDE